MPFNPLRRALRKSPRSNHHHSSVHDSPAPPVTINYTRPRPVKQDSLLKRIFKKKKTPDHVVYRDETNHFRSSRHPDPPLDLLDGEHDDHRNFSLGQGGSHMLSPHSRSHSLSNALSPPRSDAGSSHLPRRPRRKEVSHEYLAEFGLTRDGARSSPRSGSPLEGRRSGSPINVGGVTIEGGDGLVVDPETQEITLPENAVLVVDDDVQLEVRDPKTGQFVPYDQYDFGSARSVTPEDELYMVQPGADVIFEDEHGNVIYRTKNLWDSQRDRPKHDPHAPYDYNNRHSGWQSDGSYLVYSS